MSSLTGRERIKIEKLLSMSSGYVSDFSDATFYNFLYEAVDVDIHSERYQINGTSKAKKLRTFWQLESDYMAGKSILALLQYKEDNHYLSYEDTNLLEGKAIAARLMSGTNNLNHLKEATEVFGAKYLAEQISRMEQSIQTDPALAIRTAKELIETCCKTILSERGNPVTDRHNIPELTKKVLKELKLVPEGIPDSARGSDVIKRLLKNLGTIGNDLAELRSLYGTGHGKHGKTKGLSVRHARLRWCSINIGHLSFDTHKETLV
jgi:hypothetical protein